jgi:hypothetical protein
MENDMLQGINLALGAIGEQLQKSNDFNELLVNRFAKEDEEKDAEETEKAEELAKAAFTNEIVKAVVGELKKSDAGADGVGASAGGMEIDGKTGKPVGGTKWPMKGNPADDSEVDTTAEAETTKDVQKPLELGTTDVQIVKGEDGSDEYPQIEDEGVPGDSDDAMAIMNSAIGELTKAVLQLQKGQVNTESAVSTALEAQMRKIGWKEAEVGGKPQVRLLPDVGDPLQKAADASAEAGGVVGEPSPAEVVEQLSKMSYADMAEMQVTMAGSADPISGLLGS